MAEQGQKEKNINVKIEKIMDSNNDSKIKNINNE